MGLVCSMKECDVNHFEKYTGSMKTIFLFAPDAHQMPMLYILELVVWFSSRTVMRFEYDKMNRFQEKRNLILTC